MERIDLRLGPHEYPLLLGEYLLDEVTELGVVPPASRFFVVCDPTVRALYADRLAVNLNQAAPTEIIVHPKGERRKSMQTASRLIHALLAAGADRSSIVVALGGGQTGNIAGLAAALLFRGVAFVHVPTTLLAMLDSVVSLKQGVNSRHTKNAIGTYHAPAAVVADVTVLESLSMRHMRSGLCEAVKNCLVLGSQLASTLPTIAGFTKARPMPKALEEVVASHVQAKAKVLGDDPYERHQGLLFEYGHTVGHAIEFLTAGRVLHGESVGYGLLAAAETARLLGLLTDDDANYHSELLHTINVTTVLPTEIHPREVIEVLLNDTKRGYLSHAPADAIAMVLLSAIGRPVWDGERPLSVVPVAVVAEAVSSLVP